jgi:organic radical activating enzyme
MERSVKYNSIQSLKNSNDPVIIYSLTEEAEVIANACRENGIIVKAFCDNEIRKTKNSNFGLEVVYTPDLPKRFPKANFIIAHHTLDDCAEQLSDLNYSEFYSPLELFKAYDINKYSHRTSQSYMKKKIENAIKINELYFDETKTYIRSLDIVITTKCSMNCESCANLMQYYVAAKNTDSEILKAVKIISENVDHISEYRVIGGEPLMNKKWAEITNGILDQNPDRAVYIYTNATICPKDEQLESFKGKNLHFYITDYYKLSRNMDKVIEALNKHDISYYRKPAGNWVDCSRIRKHNRTISRLKQVFKECCAKQLYTLLNGKLYTCPFIANAANLNAIPENKADFVDVLSDVDNLKNKIKKLVKMKFFFPACDFCDGRPHDPAKALEYAGKGLIKAGKQIPASSSLPFEECK